MGEVEKRGAGGDRLSKGLGRYAAEWRLCLERTVCLVEGWMEEGKGQGLGQRKRHQQLKERAAGGGEERRHTGSLQRWHP